jgi:hypothetical protein
MNTQRTTFAHWSINHSAGVWIFALAVISNLILAVAVPNVDWTDQGETSRIAASIANGQGFSNPFQEPTGPSALIPPVYPYLLGGIFSVFGVFTVMSYCVAIAVNIIVHALTCLFLYWAAGEAFGRRAGLFAAIALATFPLFFYPLVLLHVLGNVNAGVGLFLPPHAIWYTHLSALAIVLLIWLTLRRSHWTVYGIAWGISALVNPGILALAPAFMAWRLWHRASWQNVGLATVVAVLCVTPWLVRNYLVFQSPVFIRDGFGLELKVGNQPGSRGLSTSEIHPWHSAYELSRVIQMGEVEYVREAGRAAMETIRSRPGEFVCNTLLRIVYYWIGDPPSSQRLHGALKLLKYLPQVVFSVLTFYGVGRALRYRNREALLFVAVLFFYPLVYYITRTYGFTFQYSIQPEMLALATSAIIREKGEQTNLIERKAAS